MNSYQPLCGYLDEKGIITGQLIDPEEITGVLEYQPFAETYEGIYEVTPKIAPQILKTQGKRMEKDVSVTGIPISVVENQSKGNTVFIG